MTSLLLAVNGTLMRGLELNGNLLEVGAQFAKEAKTSPSYRLWSINDVHPAMQKAASGGGIVELEIWEVPTDGIATVLMREPPGLCIGKIELSDGETVLGVLGEALLCDGQREITEFGGWRAYCASREPGAPGSGV
ncbi:MAG: hypothetical protein WDZ54_11150 [Sneathiella sp.]